MLCYSCDSPGIFSYKTSYEAESAFKAADLVRKSRHPSQPPLRPIFTKLLGIPANKLQHLRDLMPYVDQSSRPYYEQFVNSLTTSSTAVDTLSDVSRDEDET
ncbi:unnamed protein product [Acanthoscelides obtectus]|uniref:Uncharacterized protein n=1 Tax=Acanthoscelides obtectus TaxID=200917 RepID=A0A9P0M5P4_ACAOB|nr:unnamed protein product [Acanthoscelides obtectus]CAK1663153.1 hypothetical protein AOBTE_LOCUS23515 [Acanthoscelides obtectus]